MNFLIFDTETTGLPKRYNARWDDLNNWPRLTQFAFLLCNENGDELDKFYGLIKPNGWTIPKEKFFIDNNMSTERCEKHGTDVFDVLRQFQDALKRCDYKVAHNINFDNPIVASEMIREGITHQLFQYKKGICTMQKTTSFCNIPHKNGRGVKWPKLEELHKILFEVGFDGAHDALEDVRATKRCLIESINRGIIKL